MTLTNEADLEISLTVRLYPYVVGDHRDEVGCPIAQDNNWGEGRGRGDRIRDTRTDRRPIDVSDHAPRAVHLYADGNVCVIRG